MDKMFFVHMLVLYLIIEILSHSTNPYYLFIKQSIYDQVLLYLSYLNDAVSPNVLFTILVNTTIVTFWIFGGMFLYFDMNNIAEPFKVQKGKNSPPNPKTLQHLIYVVVRNQIIVILMSYFIGYNSMISRNSNLMDSNYIPSFKQIYIDMVISTVCYEIWFFSTHFICHRIDFLYQNIHKIHHEWTAPIGISAEYCHWLEHIIVNVFALFIGPYLMKSHIITIFILFNVGILSTISDHSGYHFPFLPSPQFHDYHHKAFHVNYGLIGFMDAIFGTDSKFKQTYNHKIHKTFYSISSYLESQSKWMGQADKFGKLN